MSATTQALQAPETECPICVSTYTKTLRRPVTCPTCQNSSCIHCAQRYLIETADDPHCMHCKAHWGRRFMLTTFNKTWLEKDYQHHRSEILWRREESFLPATMPRVELIVKGRRMTNEIIKPMEERLKVKQEEARKLLLALDINYKAAEREADQINDQLRETKYPIAFMLRGEEPPGPRAAAAAPAAPKVEFHRKCMVADCNGWLSTAWRCGVCENYTCSTCYANKGQERDAEHVCKDEDKATVALLARDTKPCPNCGMGVQRTEGCPVMFCTACHKGFNWNTLKIMETGIHNPHYFEWRNRGGGPPAPARTMGDIPCGGLPAEMWLWALAGGAEREYISYMYRTIQHITDNWFMAMYRVEGIQSLELRTKFLLGDSTKEAVQTALGTQEKSNELKTALWDCYNTCAVAGSELLRELFFHIENAVPTRLRAGEYLRTLNLSFGKQIPLDVWTRFETDAEALRMFINRSLLDVADVYRSIRNVQVIRPGWRNITSVESAISAEMTKHNIIHHDISKKVITGEQSPLLKDTGFVWYKGSIVSPDAKVLKRGAATTGGGAGGEA